MNEPNVCDVVPGIQLAIFEVIWPVKEISCITYRATADLLDVRLHATADISAEDREACERLIAEILEAAAEEMPNLASTVLFTTATGYGEGFEELMSTGIAEEIAQRHAPWRSKAVRFDA